MNRPEDPVDLVCLMEKKIHLKLSVGLVYLQSLMSTVYKFWRYVRFIVM